MESETIRAKRMNPRLLCCSNVLLKYPNSDLAMRRVGWVMLLLKLECIFISFYKIILAYSIPLLCVQALQNMRSKSEDF